MSWEGAESERTRQLAMLVDQAPDAILIKSPDGVITFWNRGAERLYGYTAQQAIGRTVEIIVPPEARGEESELLARAVAGESIQRDTVRTCRDGGLVDVSLLISPIRDDAGAVTAIAVIARDISERQRAQERIQESEERQRLLLGSLPDTMVALFDRELRCVLLQGPALAQAAVPPSHYIGRSIGETLPRGDADALLPLIQRALDGESGSVDYHAQRSGITYHAQVAPYRAPDGTIAGAFAVARDISEQRRREQELERLATIVRQSDDAIIASTLDGTITEWNDGARRLYGYQAEEALGQHLMLIAPPGLQHEQARLLARVGSGEAVGTRETRRRRRDGTLIDVSVVVSPIRDPRGEVVGASEIARDISARVRAERALARAVDGLEDAQRMARLGSWWWDPKTDEATWTAEMYRLFGRDPVDGPAIGEELLSYVPAENRADVAAGLAQALESGPLAEGDLRIVAGDGRERILHMIAQPDPERPGAFRGSMQDVTELRAVEREARAAHRRFANAIRDAPIGMALSNLEGRYTEVNDALCEITSRTREQLLGTAFAAITHPDDVDADRSLIAKLLSGELESFEVEKRYLKPSGEPVWVSLQATLLRDDAGRPLEFLGQVVDISERKRYEGQLEYLADHDQLTGLFNRRRFEEELTAMLARADRDGEPGAVLMIDIDGFKFVNDRLGHAYGDELIARIGAILLATVRDTDTIARVGGDEFAAVLADVDVDRAVAVAEKLVAAVEAEAVAIGESQHPRMTASIGLTAFGRDTGLPADELLIEADIAMYEAKEAGKNQLAVYDREGRPGPRLVSRESWINRLERAFNDDGFVLLAQPVVGIREDPVPAFELLLRLRGDDGELIPPGAFLHAAERFDLIQRIDRWVFGEALRLLHANEHAGSEFVVSVNMSAKTLCDPRLLPDLEAALARTPVRSRRLIVEVTETAAIVNIERARNVAQRLRALGCGFALDDFGAGFASFYYLKHLEFDYLKIDGEFVRSLTASVIDQLVVQSVVQIARGLGAQTVAEFVGDQETLDRLAELGVDYAQGYFVGRPLPVAEAIGMSLTPDAAG
jgi:diguanylate cyclase (GGDEF)-like protein/PAS domain S-box-containing protein